MKHSLTVEEKRLLLFPILDAFPDHCRIHYNGDILVLMHKNGNGWGYIHFNDNCDKLVFSLEIFSVSINDPSCYEQMIEFVKKVIKCEYWS